MHTILIGLNHKTTSIEIREKFHFNDLNDALHQLHSHDVIKGCVILSTCNREEIYAAVEDIELGYKTILNFLCKYSGISINSSLLDSIYKLSCADAVKHLFSVVSSLDSMVIGEVQILGQVKTAYKAAQEEHCTNPVLNKLFQTAVQVGKRIRSETTISRGAVSVGSVAVDLIKDVYDKNASFKALLIGAGHVSELTAKTLKKRRNCIISIANRSIEKAEAMAKEFNSKVVGYDKRYDAILENDVIIVSTSSKEYVINASFTKQLINKKTKTFFVDLSVPRNIDPELANIKNVTLYSIDDLKVLINSNEEKRKSEISNVMEIISSLANDYYDWYTMQTVVPVMKGIKNEFNLLGLEMLKNAKGDLGDLSENQHKVLENLMNNYSSKIIKTIMANLQSITNPSDLEEIATSLQKTFKIEI